MTQEEQEAGPEESEDQGIENHEGAEEAEENGEASSGAEKGKTIEELARDLSPTDLLRLQRKGTIRPGRLHSPVEIKDALRNLATKIPATAVQTQDYVPLKEGSIYFVRIYDPAQNLNYITIARGGRAEFTTDAAGNLISDQVLTDDDDLCNLIISAGMPVDTLIAQRGKKTKTKKGTPRKGKSPRAPAPCAFDPLVRKYIEQNGQALVFAALERMGEDRQDYQIKSPEELEELLDPAFVKRVTDRGFEVTVQSAVNFIASNKRKLRDRRIVYLNEHVQTDQIIELVSAFIREHRSGDQTKPSLDEICHADHRSRKVFDNARYVYHWFADQNTKTRVEHVVDGLRFNLLNIAGRSLDREPYREVRDTTAKILAYCKAADFVARDEFTQRDIIPLFAAAKTSVPLDTLETETGKKKTKAADTNFEVVRKLGQHILDPTQYFDDIFFRMVIRGLWMFEYLDKDKKGGSEDEIEMGRSGWGAEVEYIQPTSHLMARFQVYDQVLTESFESLRRKGACKGGLNLDTAKECADLGAKLYNNLLDRKRALFLHLRKEAPLAEGGTHLYRILRMYVGIKKEEFLERLSS